MLVIAAHGVHVYRSAIARQAQSARALHFVVRPEALSPLCILELDTFEHQRKLDRVDLHVCGGAVWPANEPKSARFKAFLNDAKSVAIPKQQLNLMPSTVDERVQVTVEEIVSEVRFDKRAQAIIALARVDRLNSDKNLHAGWECQH
ncbi:MAG TPA: hypothetical protein VJR89_09725 [Polyangiales bacterium]|jgi:hypothetical protein|nr:hypothetical protein [Polyangiales bacterium]